MEKIKKKEEINFPEEISSKYEIIQEIGRGAFSVVYKVKSKENNNIYCLKRINMKKTQDKQNEINILSNLDHPNLIKLYYSFSNDEGIYIIMEFCEYGDLFSLLQSVKKKRVYVNEEIIWNVAIQALLGLEYLHSKQIIHRDIKLLNLFLTKEKEVKIGDMGMSKQVEEGEMIMSRVGTPLYIAPELVKKEKYDYKIDIWSLGCSLYHLAKTLPPYTDENLVQLGNSIINEQPTSLPSCYSHKLYEFIMVLMTKNKDKRPSATEALKLIPQKINNILNNKKNNNYNKRTSVLKKSKNNSLEKEIVLSSKNINESKSKSNINKKELQICSTTRNKEPLERGIISGQTFYHFFKNNPDKKRNNLFFGTNNNKNIFIETKCKANNNNICSISNKENILSDLIMQVNDNENFFRIKTPENSDIKENENDDFKNNSNENKEYALPNKTLNMPYKEEDKKEDSYTNKIKKIIQKEKMNNHEFPFAKKIDEDKIANTRYNIKYFNAIGNPQNKKNISLRYKDDNIGNYFKNKNNKVYDILRSNPKINHNGMMIGFMLNSEKLGQQRSINNFHKKMINYNPINRNNVNNDYLRNSNNTNNCNEKSKEEIIFPVIARNDNKGDKFMNKSSSLNNKYSKYPEVNNFRKTVNINIHFRNKLTIHDLK